MSSVVILTCDYCARQGAKDTSDTAGWRVYYGSNPYVHFDFCSDVCHVRHTLERLGVGILPALVQEEEEVVRAGLA